MFLKNNTNNTELTTFEQDLFEKIEIGLNQIDNGQAIPAEIFFQEMEEKYHFNK